MPIFLLSRPLVALLLNQKLRGMSFFRTLLYVPAVLSGVAIAVLWFTLLNSDLGAVNQLLRTIGIEDPPNWFQDPDFALWGVAIMGLWGVGTNAIIYLAGLQNIPPDLYEAAGMDGAGAWAKFRHITLPMLSPTMFFLLIGELDGGARHHRPRHRHLGRRRRRRDLPTRCSSTCCCSTGAASWKGSWATRRRSRGS